MSLPSWCVQNVAPLTYLFWIIMLFIAQFNVFFNVFGIVQLLRKQKKEISNVFGILYIVINILFIISSITLTTHIGQSIFCSPRVLWSIIGLIGNSYSWGLSVLFLLYLYRLKLTFKDTRFGLSKYVFVVLWVGFVLQIIIPPYTAYHFLKNGAQIDWAIATLTHGVGIVLSFVFNFLLLCIFIRKLFILIKCTMQSYQQHVHMTIEEKIDLKSKLQHVLYPAIRYMVCAFISMISSNLLSILGFVRSMVYDTMTLYALHLMLIILDQSINSIFLYLQYPFGDRKYSRYCSSVHFLFQRGIASQIVHFNKHLDETDFDTFTGNTVTSTVPTTKTRMIPDSVTLKNFNVTSTTDVTSLSNI